MSELDYTAIREAMRECQEGDCKPQVIIDEDGRTLVLTPGKWVRGKWIEEHYEWSD